MMHQTPLAPETSSLSAALSRQYAGHSLLEILDCGFREGSINYYSDPIKACASEIIFKMPENVSALGQRVGEALNSYSGIFRALAKPFVYLTEKMALHGELIEDYGMAVEELFRLKLIELDIVKPQIVPNPVKGVSYSICAFVKLTDLGREVLKELSQG